MRDQIITFAEKSDFKEKYYSWSVTHMFCVTPEELQLKPDIRDFNAFLRDFGLLTSFKKNKVKDRIKQHVAFLSSAK